MTTENVDIDTVEYPFNVIGHYVTAQAVFAAHRAGLWEEFAKDSNASVNLDELIKNRSLGERYIRGIVDYLQRRNYLSWSDDRTSVSLTDLGRKLIDEHYLGYFVFMVGGYGTVLDSAARLVTGEVSYGTDLKRDGYYVAEGSELQGRHPKHKSFATINEYVQKVERCDTILDIGCGSGAFLLRLFEAAGAKRGYGIDINGPSCKLATDNVAAKGLSDAITIIEGDACDPVGSAPELEGSVDVVTAMFIVHEFISRGDDVMVDILRNLGKVLHPEHGRLLIMDKHTDVLDAGGNPPYFTEFKLLHDLTDQELCSKERWHSFFDAAGLKLNSEEVLAERTGTILFDLSRA